MILGVYIFFTALLDATSVSSGEIGKTMYLSTWSIISILLLGFYDIWSVLKDILKELKK